MEHLIIPAPPFVELERVYQIQAMLKSFKGRRDVLVHLFRVDPDESELETLRGMKLVADRTAETPADADPEQTLHSILEAFTAEEGNALLAYLKAHYETQITRVTVFPLETPLALGIMPFSAIPEGKSMGFIRFTAVAHYNVPFAVWGFYDLEAHEPLITEEM